MADVCDEILPHAFQLPDPRHVVKNKDRPGRRARRISQRDRTEMEHAGLRTL